MNDLHGILFAYHSDSNLGELTRPRNTCSLPFGGRYRLIDFMLSSYVNAGISDVGMIVHANYQSLLDHVGSGKDWDLSRKHGGLRILPPFGVAERGGSGEYRGNMEALAGIYTYLQNIRQEYVIMGWGDMVVNLPVAEVFHHPLHPGAEGRPPQHRLHHPGSRWTGERSVHQSRSRGQRPGVAGDLHHLQKAAAGHGGLLRRP